MNDDRWYSDEALRKQAALKQWDEATRGPVPIEMLCGVIEPRVHATEAESCHCCGTDARDEVDGIERDGLRFCYLCVGRGHDEDHECDASCSARGRVGAS